MLVFLQIDRIEEKSPALEAGLTTALAAGHQITMIRGLHIDITMSKMTYDSLDKFLNGNLQLDALLIIQEANFVKALANQLKKKPDWKKFLT